DVIVQLVGRARAGHEIRQVVRLRQRGVAGGGRSGGAAELPAVRVVAVHRVEIVDRRVDALVFVAKAQRVPRHEFAEVDLRIDHEWILELRIAGLPSELGKTADVLRIERALHARVLRQAGDAVRVQQAGLAQPDRALAAFGPGDSQPRFERGPWIDGPGGAG